MDIMLTQARRQRRTVPATDPAIFAELAAMPLLADRPPTTVALLAAHARPLSYRRDEFVFRRGAQPTGLYFVTDGAVKLIARDPDGRERVIELFGERQFFGEIGVFRLSKYRAWTRAVGNTRLLHVPSAPLIEAVRRDPELAVRMLSEVSGRVQGLIESISQAAPLHAYKRVAAYLMEQFRDSATADNWIRLAAPKYTIASMLNLSGEAVSRALRKLREENIIEGSGRNIRIIDPAGLGAMLTA